VNVTRNSAADPALDGRAEFRLADGAPAAGRLSISPDGRPPWLAFGLNIAAIVAGIGAAP
jgi:hypothetical protein